MQRTFNLIITALIFWIFMQCQKEIIEAPPINSFVPKWDTNLDDIIPFCDDLGDYKYGYYSKKLGRVIIEPKYDEAYVFCNGCSMIELNNNSSLLFVRLKLNDIYDYYPIKPNSTDLKEEEDRRNRDKRFFELRLLSAKHKHLPMCEFSKHFTYDEKIFKNDTLESSIFFEEINVCRLQTKTTTYWKPSNKTKLLEEPTWMDFHRKHNVAVVKRKPHRLSEEVGEVIIDPENKILSRVYSQIEYGLSGYFACRRNKSEGFCLYDIEARKPITDFILDNDKVTFFYALQDDYINYKDNLSSYNHIRYLSKNTWAVSKDGLTWALYNSKKNKLMSDYYLNITRCIRIESIYEKPSFIETTNVFICTDFEHKRFLIDKKGEILSCYSGLIESLDYCFIVGQLPKRTGGNFSFYFDRSGQAYIKSNLNLKQDETINLEFEESIEENKIYHNYTFSFNGFGHVSSSGEDNIKRLKLDNDSVSFTSDTP